MTRSYPALIALIISVAFNGHLAHADTDTMRSALDDVIFGNKAKNIKPATNKEIRAITHAAVTKETVAVQPNKKPSSAEDPLYLELKKRTFGMTPDQIRDLTKTLDEQQRAQSEPPSIVLPVKTTTAIDLSPGSIIPSMSLSVNKTSSITILDSTGAPWPILELDKPPETLFTITHPTNKAHTHILKITPKERYATGNLSLTFEGLNVPIAITLTSDYQKNTYEISKEFQIAALGPNAKPELNRAPAVATEEMLEFLQGIPPANAKLVNTDNMQLINVWELNRYYYVITRADLVLPAPVSQSSAGDGTHVFKTHMMSSLNLNSDGEFIQVTVME